MAFRALLFSKNPETVTAMTVACETSGVRLEVCDDIFTAIEKVKTRAFSCIIPDWADQPEAGFLLKRARESAPNHESFGVAVVDREPSAAEMTEHRLSFLIYRPISVTEAAAVIGKACKEMKPLSAQDAAEPAPEPAAPVPSEASAAAEPEPPARAEESVSFESAASAPSGEEAAADVYSESQPGGHTAVVLQVVAALALVAATFSIWKSRDTLLYLAGTKEGPVRVLRESVAAYFFVNQGGAMPVGSAGADAQQDSYFSRVPSASNAPALRLGVAATESDLSDSRVELPKAMDFPLPVPVFAEPQAAPPVHIERAAIPDSMKTSPPITRPVIVTVNPAQMMPVSSPPTQPYVQPATGPVSLNEETVRSLLVHRVDPAYPPEASAQKMHGPVVLQAMISAEGTVEELKLVRGYFVLSKAAIAAVKQWQFQPYIVNGRAAQVQTVITVNF